MYRMTDDSTRGFDIRCDVEAERFPDSAYDLAAKSIAFLQLAPFKCESDMIQAYGRLCRMGDKGIYYRTAGMVGHENDGDLEY